MTCQAGIKARIHGIAESTTECGRSNIANQLRGTTGRIAARLHPFRYSLQIRQAAVAPNMDPLRRSRIIYNQLQHRWSICALPLRGIRNSDPDQQLNACTMHVLDFAGKCRNVRQNCQPPGESEQERCRTDVFRLKLHQYKCRDGMTAQRGQTIPAGIMLFAYRNKGSSQSFLFAKQKNAGLSHPGGRLR